MGRKWVVLGGFPEVWAYDLSPGGYVRAQSELVLSCPPGGDVRALVWALTFSDFCFVEMFFTGRL